MRELILVTGGAGFIGSHIVDAFLAAGHSVAVVDNLSTGKKANLNPEARFYEADIRKRDDMDSIFSAERPTVVCHQAALADVRGSLADPSGYAQTNVIGTLNLLEACRGTGTVRKLLFASTGGAVYGEPAQLPAPETCPPRPLDPYGASKLACEHFIDTYRHNYGLDYAVLRYGNVYGPRQDPFGEAGVVAIFTAAMLARRPVVINGDGTQVRDFVYVGDVAQANLSAIGPGSGIYNVGTGVPTDINTVYRELARLTEYPLDARHGPPKQGEVHTTFLDIAKAQRELDWRPRITLDEGLGRTVSYFQL